jgi:hypothetical protein
VGFVVDKMALGQVFSEYFEFPCQFSFHLLHSTIGQIGAYRRNEWLHDLYCPPSIIRMIKSRNMRWAGTGARMGAKRNACRILVVKPEGNIPLGRPRHKWVHNIKMDFKEMACYGLD